MKPLRGVAALVGFALIAAACSSGSGGGSTSQGGPVKQGGTLRIGTMEGIDSLNPFVGFNQDAYSAWFYIYPSLEQYALPDYTFAPNLATSYQMSSDGLSWTFHLAPGAKWSDGQPSPPRTWPGRSTP